MKGSTSPARKVEMTIMQRTRSVRRQGLEDPRAGRWPTTLARKQKVRTKRPGRGTFTGSRPKRKRNATLSMNSPGITLQTLGSLLLISSKRGLGFLGRFSCVSRILRHLSFMAGGKSKSSVEHS